MEKVTIIILALLCSGYIIISAVTYNIPKPASTELDVYTDPGYWKNQALKDIIPFWEKTIDRKNGGFYCDVMRDGNVDPTNGKYPMMISEIVYGFSAAYMLSGDGKYLEYAGHALDYLTNYGWDKVNGGWNSYLDTSNLPATNDFMPNLYIKYMYVQDYCSLGPVFYYMATGDKNSLEYVKKTHDLIREHAWDSQNGGYFSEVSTNWLMSTTMKSISAQIDTCSYLIYYYLALRDKSLLTDLIRLAGLVRTHMIDPETGFAGENFDIYWRSQEQTLSTMNNLETGWVMMRSYNLTKIQKFEDTAEKILQVQISNNWDTRYSGWYSRFNFTNALTNDESKDLYSLEEGDKLLLTLYRQSNKKEYLDRFRESAWFWDKYIVDHKYGECHPEVARDGRTWYSEIKGGIYKSASNTMEHALFNYLYLSLYVEKKEPSLYFRIGSAKAGERHYVMLTEDNDVVIKRVTIDGKDWPLFNSKEGYVTLPEGRNLKIMVTYAQLK